MNPSFTNQKTLEDLQKLFGSTAKAAYNQDTQTIMITDYDIDLYGKNQIILHNLILIFEHVLTPE